ncbi:MAG: hypothetical protein D6690_00720 [Nitrospirae bacterium]|nr:MAG: hypothetical protein D6690_00720 [Nitrospirota bacterium]
MVIASVFGLIICAALVIGDWYQFTSLQSWATRYGCGIARRRDTLPISSDRLTAVFGPYGVLSLPHGIARWFPAQGRIVIRPSYRLFSLRFRTAWPLKGTVDVIPNAQGLTLHMTKRIPWTSAILTILWLGIVAGGTMVFLVMYGLDGGFQSARGALLALGIVAVGLLVLGFGLILLSLAYRLEDHRLMEVYYELQATVTDPCSPVIPSISNETPMRNIVPLQQS